MIRVIDNTNPCKCGNGGDCPWYRTTDEGNHILTCTHCGHGHFDGDLQKLIDRWNEDNPLPEPSKDWTWQQAQELAQAGKMDEAVVTTIKAPSPIDAALRLHVKKTADELPEEDQQVLVWHSHYKAWISARYANKVWWFSDWHFSGYCDDLQDHGYWLPLPTFNPESEG